MSNNTILFILSVILLLAFTYAMVRLITENKNARKGLNLIEEAEISPMEKMRLLLGWTSAYVPKNKLNELVTTIKRLEREQS
jgi:hypothetical protein